MITYIQSGTKVKRGSILKIPFTKTTFFSSGAFFVFFFFCFLFWSSSATLLLPLLLVLVAPGVFMGLKLFARPELLGTWPSSGFTSGKRG